MTLRRSLLTLSIGIALVLSVSAVSSLRTAEPLPGRFSDDAFWRMITGFSEEGGYFRFENFLSNELAFQQVIPALKDTTKPGGIYLGVLQGGPWPSSGAVIVISQAGNGW